MAPVSEGAQSKGLRRLSSEARCTFGAPSAWIFLGRLHSCRAGLRFSRRQQPSQFALAINVKARTTGSTWTEAIAKARSSRPRQDARVAHRVRMPLKKSSDFGRSRGRCLDFLLLIGATPATPPDAVILGNRAALSDGQAVANLKEL